MHFMTAIQVKKIWEPIGVFHVYYIKIHDKSFRFAVYYANHLVNEDLKIWM